MYDLVIHVPPNQKQAYYATSVAASGTLTYSTAIYTLTNNAGTLLASGTVDNHDAADALTVRAWKVLDAAAIPLPIGPSILEILSTVVGSDGITRNESVRIVLFVPGG